MAAWQLLIANSITWVLLFLFIGYAAQLTPDRAFDRFDWLLRPKEWEEQGVLYERLFRVRSWKAHLPPGGTIFRGFSLGRVSSHQCEYLRQWLGETKRAELTHWLGILASVTFFLFNPPVGGAINVLFALVFNTPSIIAQRYNRLRLMALLDKYCSERKTHQ